MQSDKVKVMAGSHDGDAVEQHVAYHIIYGQENRTTPCGCIQHAKTLAKQISAKDRPTTFESLTNISQPLDNVLEQIEGCRQRCSQDHTLVDTVVAISEDILHLCYTACSTYRLVDSDSGLENNNNYHYNIDNNTTSQQLPALTITTTASAAPSTTTNALPILTPTTSPSSSSASSTTTSLSSTSAFLAKSPMTLGNLELDDEEAGLLARQIIYTILTNLSALLRSVYSNRDNRTGSSIDPTWLSSLSSSSSLPSLYGREVDVPVSRTLSRVLALLGKLFSE